MSSRTPVSVVDVAGARTGVTNVASRWSRATSWLMSSPRCSRSRSAVGGRGRVDVVAQLRPRGRARPRPRRRPGRRTARRSVWSVGIRRKLIASSLGRSARRQGTGSAVTRVRDDRVGAGPCRAIIRPMDDATDYELLDVGGAAAWSGSASASSTGRTRRARTRAAIPRPGSAPTCASIATAAGADRAADAGPWPIESTALTPRAARRPTPARSGSSRSTRRCCPWLRPGRTDRRAAPRSSTCSPTPGSPRWRWPPPARRSPTSTRRGRPSPGRAATPSCPGWPTGPIRWIVDDARGVRRARGPARAPLRRGRPRPADLRARLGGRRLADRGRPRRRCSTRCAAHPRAGRLRAADRPHARRSAPTGSPTRSPRGLGRRRAASRRATSASRPTDGRAPRARAPSPGRPAGHDGDDALPAPAAADEPRQPAGQGRVRPARPARARAAGLTLVDGARELRRALDAGVEVVEAFVCEPLLAGPDARAALDRAARRRDDRCRSPRASRSSRSSPSATGPRASSRSSAIPDLDARATSTLPADPLVVVIEGVEKPGNLGAVLRTRRRRRVPTP